VKVDAKGKVELEMADATREWAKGQLSSIIGHRLSDGDLDTPCAFADDVKDHRWGGRFTSSTTNSIRAIASAIGRSSR